MAMNELSANQRLDFQATRVHLCGPATIAWTSPVVSRDSMDPSETDELQTADDDINHLIGLVAKQPLELTRADAAFMVDATT